MKTKFRAALFAAAALAAPMTITTQAHAQAKAIAVANNEEAIIQSNAFKNAMETKEFRDFCDTQGITIAMKNPEEFARFWEQDDRKWQELTTIGGIKPE